MELHKKKCSACEEGTTPLSQSAASHMLKNLTGWNLQNNCLVKTFTFKNYYETVAFINSVVWIAHTEDHHPEISFGYKSCEIKYSTHSLGGLSENDFICASKIDVLLA